MIKSLINKSWNSGYVSKDLLDEWTNDYIIQTGFGYKYLHSDNIIIIKIYNEEKEMFVSLVIHLEGNTECIIENNHKLMNIEDIQILMELYYFATTTSTS